MANKAVSINAFLSVGSICMCLCFDHSSCAIMPCSYVSHAYVYVSHALCFCLLFVAHMVGGSSVNCALKLCMRPIKLSREPSQEIHLLSHTLMSSLPPSPSLSSTTQPLLQGRKQHNTQNCLKHKLLCLKTNFSPGDNPKSCFN